MTGPGFFDFAFLALRDFLGLEGAALFQVGGGRCQKGVVDAEAGPVLKEYPSCVLQEEGEARLGDGSVGETKPPLYAPAGDADDIPGAAAGPGRVQRAPRCCRSRGTPST